MFHEIQKIQKDHLTLIAKCSKILFNFERNKFCQSFFIDVKFSIKNVYTPLGLVKIF